MWNRFFYIQKWYDCVTDEYYYRFWVLGFYFEYKKN